MLETRHTKVSPFNAEDRGALVVFVVDMDYTVIHLTDVFITA